MSRRILLALLALVTAALATRMWTDEESQSFFRAYRPQSLPRPESLLYGPRRFNYLRQVKLTCDFVARYQVSDSLSPDFGGIIEAEHMPTTVETDNTQEAIWIWSRWYELTGHDDFRENIRRAWVYVKGHAAYREHGGSPSNVWYAVWNTGLGFMAEAEYRRAYGDSAFLAYADTCRTFYLQNPLGSVNVLDVFVTGQSSGMAYEYAVLQADQTLRDTALARGGRVKSWIETGARTRLGYQNWAMCGGTAFWGVAHTVGREDTVAGKAWAAVYSDSLPGFYPSGTWNCSHNIWLANAYRAAAELGHDTLNWTMHHYLVDTLLARDGDDDGGIPATWTDPNTQDQTWVSTYLDFMGMDVFVTPTYDHDMSLLEFLSPSAGKVYVVGDSIPVVLPIANVGKTTSGVMPLVVRMSGYADSIFIAEPGFLETDTFRWMLAARTPAFGWFEALTLGDDNPVNDSVRVDFKVYDTCRLTGTLVDSVSGQGIPSWVKARLGTDTLVWDSVYTDRSGNFSLLLLDTLFAVSIEPAIPYYARSWDFAIHGDTTVSLVTQPAHVLIVNNDTLERYASYYTSTLDTLGVTWCLWNRPSGGLLPYSQLGRLRSKAVIWYSGSTNTGTIPAEDRDSLTGYLGTGTNLFITGQNVAQELAGSPFLESICGCRFDSSGWAGFFVFGDRADSLGTFVPGTATTGGNGAGNQTSRDVISPTVNSTGFLVYDSVTVKYAGTRRQTPSGGKVVFAGFGFEAVNRPAAKPTYFNRMQLMDLILTWFGAPSGIADRQPLTANRQSLPTVVRGRLLLPSAFCPLTLDFGLFDHTGRRVLRLHAGANDLSRLPAGIYFLESHGSHVSHRLLLVR